MSRGVIHYGAILDRCGDDATWSVELQDCKKNAPLRPVHEINGIPFAQVERIFRDHQAEIQAIPGIMMFGLGADGIDVQVGGGTRPDRRPCGN